MVIKDILIDARKFLEEKGIDSREARLLLAYSMDISADELIRFSTCTPAQYEKFISYLNRRTAGEPFAYIVGYKEFMKLKFNVCESVLIPREDTEILVQKVIELNKKKILDMCTGSGCIAISLAHYINDSVVDAADLSKEALEVAKKNAMQNNVKVNFIHSNLFENVSSKYDLIASNPPYVPSKDIKTLQIEVKNEPVMALDGGEDGLDFYRIISKKAKNYLEEKGILVFEIGYNQAEDVSEILGNNGYNKIEVIKDLSGNDRVVFAERGEI